MHYILDGTTPVPADLFTWGHWFQAADRHVASTDLAGGVTVSTVFLGLDHQWGAGPPLLFETMVFWPNGPLDTVMERYATWHEAEQGHEAMVARVRAALVTPPDG